MGAVLIVFLRGHYLIIDPLKIELFYYSIGLTFSSIKLIVFLSKKSHGRYVRGFIFMNTLLIIPILDKDKTSASKGINMLLDVSICKIYQLKMIVNLLH